MRWGLRWSGPSPPISVHQRLLAVRKAPLQVPSSFIIHPSSFSSTPFRVTFHPMFAPFILLVVAVLYRLLIPVSGVGDDHWLQNFAPISAIALCGAAYLPRRYALVLPLGILLCSDFVLNVFYYQQPLLTLEIVPRYLALTMIVALGAAIHGKVRIPGLMGASLLGSLIFYVVTNTGSWLGEPLYPGGIGGWVQALTVGLPGYPSTLWFYKQTLVSDLVFTLLFAMCVAVSRPAPDPATAPAHS